MNVGFVQFAPYWGNKARNCETIQRLMEQHSADLWVLPELFNTGYMFTSHEEIKALAEPIPDGETTQFLINLAKAGNSTIVAGVAEIADDSIFNSAIMVNQSGVLLKYRKVHLFDQEKKWFLPGTDGYTVVEIDSARVGVMICFDWVFPEAARSLALQGADIIAHPSNLVLPHCQQAMITRCLENRLFAVTANRVGAEHRDGNTLSFTGQSQIVAPNGTVVHRAEKSSELAYTCRINISDARNKFMTPHNDLFQDRKPGQYSFTTQ